MELVEPADKGSGGDSGDSGGCMEERVLIGDEISGGCGASKRATEDQSEDGSGHAGVSWGCVEDRELVGDSSAGGVAFWRSINGKTVNRKGKVEGTVVHDVVLDTDCACTMLRRDLVPEERVMAGATIRLRCAHGDVVTYPLAAVRLEFDGLLLHVTTAVAGK